MSTDACADRVARGDPDRFAATLAAPGRARARLLPLYALNLELARAPWASAEPVIAEMRLQWWIDALGALEAGQAVTPHEVLTPVNALMREVPALAAPLMMLAEARRGDCWREPLADDAALDAYIGATAGNLMWAAALALGAAAAAKAVVRDFAWGVGLANWLRAVPQLQARGQLPLSGFGPEAVASLARTGLARIARARSARAAIAPTVAPALYPGWMAVGVLKRAAAEPARVANGQLESSEFARRAGLLMPAFFGRW